MNINQLDALSVRVARRIRTFPYEKLNSILQRIEYAYPMLDAHFGCVSWQVQAWERIHETVGRELWNRAEGKYDFD